MKLISTAKKGFTLIELMIVVAIIGILAAIAIPNFIKFQQRAKQSEPKGNLKGWFTAQKAWYQERSSYVTGSAGFVPERGNRYQYLFGAGTFQDRSTVNLAANSSGGDFGVDTFKHADLKFAGADGMGTLTPVGPASLVREGGGGAALGLAAAEVTIGSDGDFVGYAIGDIDNETTGLDNWFVSSQSGTITPNDCIAPAGDPIYNVSSGSPANTWNDVSCDAP